MSEVEVEAAQQEPNLPASSAQEPPKVIEETKQDEVHRALKTLAQADFQTEQTTGDKKEETPTEPKIDTNNDKREETLTEPKVDTNGDKKEENLTEPKVDTNGDKKEETLAEPRGDTNGDKKDQESSTEANATESITAADKKDDGPSAETEAKGGDTNGEKKAEQSPVATDLKEGATVSDKKDERSLDERNVTEVVKTESQQPEVETASNEKKQPEPETQKDEISKRKPEYSRGNYQNQNRRTTRRDNIKFDPSTLEISSDPDEIRKQVEFYFSDSNLPMDKFLLEKVGGTSNHPVDIKVIHNFKRMRHFQPYSAVIAALKDSQFLEVTEGEQVRRRVPLPKEALGANVHEGRRIFDDRSIPRSIYAKGFDAETPTTQFEIEAFFAPYGPTNAIRLRRTMDNIFKGSVFVEFADEATQQAFLAIEPKPKWKGKDLLIKSKKDYVEGKAADIDAGRIKPQPKPRYNDNSHRGNDQNDWKKRREEDQRKGFRDDRGRGGHSYGRGNDRGRGKGQGDRGKGRGGGRGGRGGRNFRERDPHKVPEIRTSTPESAGEVPIKKQPNKSKLSDSQPSAPKTTPNTDNNGTATEAKPNLPTTSTDKVGEIPKEPHPTPIDTTPTPAPPKPATPAPAPAPATAAVAVATEGMDIDPAAGKKRAREHDDAGHKEGVQREGTPPKKQKIVDVDGNGSSLA